MRTVQDRKGPHVPGAAVSRGVSEPVVFLTEAASEVKNGLEQTDLSLSHRLPQLLLMKVFGLLRTRQSHSSMRLHPECLYDSAV